MEEKLNEAVWCRKVSKLKQQSWEEIAIEVGLKTFIKLLFLIFKEKHRKVPKHKLYSTTEYLGGYL